MVGYVESRFLLVRQSPHLGSSRSTGVVSATSELGGIGAALGLAFGEKYCNSLALRQKALKNT